MAIIKKKDLKKMDKKQMSGKLNELQLELAKERASINIGANVTSPGKMKEIKRTIARLKAKEREMVDKK